MVHRKGVHRILKVMKCRKRSAAQTLALKVCRALSVPGDSYCVGSSYTSEVKLLLSQVLEESLVYNLHLSDSFFSLVPASKMFVFFRLLLPAGADKDGVGYCTVCDGCSLQLVPSAAIKRWLVPFCFPH